jgi:hypothetical protein
MFSSSFVYPRHGFIGSKRDIKDVPFVELFNGRLQGVVSSGSDIERVYVSFFEAVSLDYYCSTNNNRPCGGLRGTPCKHLQALLNEAIAQFSVEEVAKYLQIPGNVHNVYTIPTYQGNIKKEPANQVFSRFLNYLRYLELPNSNLPLPEMSWFVN